MLHYKYDKPLLIWINWGGEVIRNNEAKNSPKRQKKSLRKQKNGKFNNIVSADENKFKKNITAAVSSSARS
jgi:hypothetical protein